MQADLGNGIAAHRIFDTSLERARRILGPVHPLTVAAVVGLARAYDRESRASDAERILIETLEAVTAAIGSDNFLYARLLRQLGAARMDAKPIEAIPPLEYAARWFEAALGKDSVQVAITLNNLAFAYAYLERVDEAGPANAFLRRIAIALATTRDIIPSKKVEAGCECGAIRRGVAIALDSMRSSRRG